MEDRFDNFGLETPFASKEDFFEDFDWPSGQPGENEELDWLDSEAPWAEGELSESAQATALEGGLVWTEDHPGLGAPVTCFLSPGALRARELEVLVYVHGLLHVCGWPAGGMQELITSREFPFAKQIAASGRAMLLVVPQLQMKPKERWNARGLEQPAKLGSLVAQTFDSAWTDGIFTLCL